VIVLGKGRTVADVADALLIDPETVRAYFKRYKKGGFDELLRISYFASEALPDAVQLAELGAHLHKHLHLTRESVARWGKVRWGVCSTVSDMAAVLRRLGNVYKKPKLVGEKRRPRRKRNSSEIRKTSRKSAMRTTSSCSWPPRIRSTMQ
jgi:transposase